MMRRPIGRLLSVIERWRFAAPIVRCIVCGIPIELDGARVEVYLPRRCFSVVNNRLVIMRLGGGCLWEPTVDSVGFDELRVKMWFESGPHGVEDLLGDVRIALDDADLD